MPDSGSDRDNSNFERNSLWVGIAMSVGTCPAGGPQDVPTRFARAGSRSYDPSDFALGFDSSYG